jgi:DNA polymerase III epsilon subunit-like protein
MLFMPFAEAVAYMNDFIDHHGGTFATHCLYNDLGFLKATQDHVGGKRVVKQTMQSSPKTGMYDKRWETFTLVCTMTLLCTRCPKFIKSYQTSKPYTTASGKYASMQLENLTRFVKDDPTYKQGHSAAQDVIDLCEVLREVHKCDGDKMFDGYDCMNWDVTSTLPKVDEPATQKQIDYFKTLYAQKKVPFELDAEMKSVVMNKDTISVYIDRLKQL